MKDGRLHIRIDAELAERAKEYAAVRHTTITALVAKFLLDLVESEKADESVEPAEQI